MVSSKKYQVYDWFRTLDGAKRIDFLNGMLHLCFPLELRFLGSCIEELARKEYSYLRDAELKANASYEIQLMNEISDKVTRSKMIVTLALLGSNNFECARLIYDLLNVDIGSLLEKMEEAHLDQKIADEFLLMLTMAANHPAFDFQMKTRMSQLYLCADQKLKIKKVIPNESEADLCLLCSNSNCVGASASSEIGNEKNLVNLNHHGEAVIASKKDENKKNFYLDNDLNDDDNDDDDDDDDDDDEDDDEEENERDEMSNEYETNLINNEQRTTRTPDVDNNNNNNNNNHEIIVENLVAQKKQLTPSEIDNELDNHKENSSFSGGSNNNNNSSSSSANPVSNDSSLNSSNGLSGNNENPVKTLKTTALIEMVKFEGVQTISGTENYKFMMKVEWSDKSVNELEKTYSEIYEFNKQLNSLFPNELTELNSIKLDFKEDQKEDFVKEIPQVTDFCSKIATLPKQVCESEFLKAFFLKKLNSKSQAKALNQRSDAELPKSASNKTETGKSDEINAKVNAPFEKNDTSEPLLAETKKNSSNFKSNISKHKLIESSTSLSTSKDLVNTATNQHKNSNNCGSLNKKSSISNGNPNHLAKSKVVVSVANLMNTDQSEVNSTANVKSKENLNQATQKNNINPVNNLNNDQTKKKLQHQQSQSIPASNYPHGIHSNFNPSNLKQQQPQFGVPAFQPLHLHTFQPISNMIISSPSCNSPTPNANTNTNQTNSLNNSRSSSPWMMIPPSFPIAPHQPPLQNPSLFPIQQTAPPFPLQYQNLSNHSSSNMLVTNSSVQNQTLQQQQPALLNSQPSNNIPSQFYNSYHHQNPRTSNKGNGNGNNKSYNNKEQKNSFNHHPANNFQDELLLRYTLDNNNLYSNHHHANNNPHQQHNYQSNQPYSQSPVEESNIDKHFVNKNNKQPYEYRNKNLNSHNCNCSNNKMITLNNDSSSLLSTNTTNNEQPCVSGTMSPKISTSANIRSSSSCSSSSYQTPPPSTTQVALPIPLPLQLHSPSLTSNSSSNTNNNMNAAANLAIYNSMHQFVSVANYQQQHQNGMQLIAPTLVNTQFNNNFSPLGISPASSQNLQLQPPSGAIIGPLQTILPNQNTSSVLGLNLDAQKPLNFLSQSTSFHSNLPKTNSSRYQNRSKSPDPSIIRGISSNINNNNTNNKLKAGSLTTSDDEETIETSLSSQKSNTNNNLTKTNNNNKNGQLNTNRQTSHRQHYNSLSISSSSSSSSSILPQPTQSNGPATAVNVSFNKNQTNFIMSSPPPQVQTSINVLSSSSQASPALGPTSLSNSIMSTNPNNNNLVHNYGSQVNDQQQVATFSPAGSTKNTKSFNSIKPNVNSTTNMSANKQELLLSTSSGVCATSNLLQNEAKSVKNEFETSPKTESTPQNTQNNEALTIGIDTSTTCSTSSSTSSSSSSEKGPNSTGDKATSSSNTNLHSSRSKSPPMQKISNAQLAQQQQQHHHHSIPVNMNNVYYNHPFTLIDGQNLFTITTNGLSAISIAPPSQAPSHLTQQASVTGNQLQHGNHHSNSQMIQLPPQQPPQQFNTYGPPPILAAAPPPHLNSHLNHPSVHSHHQQQPPYYNLIPFMPLNQPPLAPPPSLPQSSQTTHINTNCSTPTPGSSPNPTQQLQHSSSNNNSNSNNKSYNNNNNNNNYIPPPLLPNQPQGGQFQNNNSSKANNNNNNNNPQTSLIDPQMIPPYNYMMALAAQSLVTNNGPQSQQQHPPPHIPPNMIMMMMNQPQMQQMNSQFNMKQLNSNSNNNNGPNPPNHNQQQQQHHHNQHHFPPPQSYPQNYYQMPNQISPSLNNINNTHQQHQSIKPVQQQTYHKKKSCYNCGSMNHVANECSEPTIESSMSQTNQFRLNFKPNASLSNLSNPSSNQTNLNSNIISTNTLTTTTGAPPVTTPNSANISNSSNGANQAGALTIGSENSSTNSEETPKQN